MREEVYKALETARAEKTIGTSLEAAVVIDAPEEEIALLKSFGDGLRFLFITSQVLFGSVGESALRSEAIPGLAIEVRRAAGEKCARCWNYTEDVGDDGEWPEVCARCAGHVREYLSGAGAS